MKSGGKVIKGSVWRCTGDDDWLLEIWYDDGTSILKVVPQREDPFEWLCKVRAIGK